MSKKESTEIDSIASSVLFSHCPVITKDPEVQGNKQRLRLPPTVIGYIDYILGIQIIRDSKRGTIHLSQRQYLIDTLNRYGMIDCKPASTPFPAGYKPVKDDSDISSEEAKIMMDAPYIN